MQRFRAGSEIAFQIVMKQHLRALTFHVYRICRNKEVAEEVVADTFSKLWQRKAGFQTELNIKSFLYITARNASLDYIRSAQRRNSYRSQELDDELLLCESDPLTQLIHSELIASLVEEINKLPPRQRDVFRMFYIEGYSTSEICTHLAITPNAVSVAKKKARGTIRKVFSETELFTCFLLVQLLLVH